MRIGITNPNSCWALAGLHTGDIISSIDGRMIYTWQDFQAAIDAVHVGDTIIVDISTGTETISHKVIISGYTKPVITITEDPAATGKQRRLLRQWLDAK